MVNSAGLFRVLSEAAGRSRCFAFWQEFSKVLSPFFPQMLVFRVYSYASCKIHSVMPKRTTPKSAAHKPKTTWSVCITLKRHA